MTKIRIRYERGDELKFISHLDILKLFERAARRCDLPVSYTEGFNPRPKFVFGNPLPVGVTSECEFVDIHLTKDMSSEEVINMLNDVMPKGVRMLDATELSDKNDNIMATVSASEYILTVTATKEELDKFINAYLLNIPLNVEKRSKSGSKMMDIRHMIRDLKIEDDKIVIITDAGNTNNLRPELAVSALNEYAGTNIVVNHIHRKKLL